MKKIFFFGDSFTFGEGCRKGFEYYDTIDYDDKRIWTTIVSDTLNLEEINYGKRGCASAHILSSLLKHSSEFEKGDYVIFSDSLPNRIVSANQKEKQIDSVIADNFEGFYGLDNFFEDLKSKQVLLDYLYHHVLPFPDAYSYFYNRQFEQMQKLLLKTGVKSFFWSYTMWAQNMKKYQRISNHTNIKDGHFSWQGHKEFSEMILHSIKNEKYFIHKNLI